MLLQYCIVSYLIGHVQNVKLYVQFLNADISNISSSRKPKPLNSKKPVAESESASQPWVNFNVQICMVVVDFRRLNVIIDCCRIDEEDISLAILMEKKRKEQEATTIPVVVDPNHLKDINTSYNEE